MGAPLVVGEKIENRLRNSSQKDLVCYLAFYHNFIRTVPHPDRCPPTRTGNLQTEPIKRFYHDPMAQPFAFCWVGASPTTTTTTPPVPSGVFFVGSTGVDSNMLYIPRNLQPACDTKLGTGLSAVLGDGCAVLWYCPGCCVCSCKPASNVQAFKYSTDRGDWVYTDFNHK